MKESAGDSITCPADQVLLGRSHSGDENGNTTYYCGSILIDGKTVTTSALTWSNSQWEGDSAFSASTNEVLVGREHCGDENGTTWYRYAKISGISG